jgi:hypothetical protein
LRNNERTEGIRVSCGQEAWSEKMLSPGHKRAVRSPRDGVFWACGWITGYPQTHTADIPGCVSPSFCKVSLVLSTENLHCGHLKGEMLIRMLSIVAELFGTEW